MEDFYEILDLDRFATASQIKVAYKRLAKKYHPDRNPGNLEAEEKFKKINEAYHALSDPYKKFEYDNRHNFVAEETPSEEYFYEIKKKRYSQWQQAQQKTYKLDREYFKIQGLAFLVFIVISGICFAIIHTGSYFIQQKNLERWRANSQSLKEVNALFVEGKIDDAFNLIHTLKQKDPLDFRFEFTRDSLVSELRTMADEKYNQKEFPAAVIHYMALKNYEEPTRYETVRKISLCQYYLGNFKEALQALKHLHNQRAGDLELVYQIGNINLEKLNNPTEALQYFTLGKKLFKENLSKVYGAAFEVVMDPADAPDIYFDLFLKRAQTNILLENYEEAVTDCNWAIYLRPVKGEPYKLRALSNSRLQKYHKVCSDLYNARRLGVTDIDMIESSYCR